MNRQIHLGLANTRTLPKPTLEASKRELQRRARERAVQIRRYQIAEEL